MLSPASRRRRSSRSAVRASPASRALRQPPRVAGPLHALRDLLDVGCGHGALPDEHQDALRVGPQLPAVASGELDQPGHGGAVDRYADLRRALLDLSRELRGRTEASALHPGRVLVEELRDPAGAVQGLVRHEDERRRVDRLLDALDQRLERAIGRLALARRGQHPLCLKHDDDPSGRHHRECLDGVGDRAGLEAGVCPIQPLDIERAQLWLNRVREQPRQLRLEHLVRALDQIQRPHPARGDVRSELLGREGGLGRFRGHVRQP